ncbi:phosphoserine phosphatase SerB [Cognatishimia sp. F0-27]|uniref:phosphoserine phosphatase SerB n=1 Tax=Cognatishimia sp. F0-27 TaxID=2816855 RepID=UPI001D0C2B77|nr:phosphoserine phosphatase SerB [Cognatishimia sp. F0-27]MCC1491268.1 phosphoserine phosphatase SerB [Cognatishimia sp. F0-27]
MHIASLIARPGHLDPALVEALRNALGGGTADWLSPDEAAEFPLQTLPGNIEDIRRSIAEQADLNIVPAQNRRKALLIADMDSTMIEQECIDELAEEAGVGAHVKDITARAMNGELDFEGALTERVALLKDQPETVIQRVIDTRITLMPGGRALVSTMKANGAHAALVSGGFTAFTSRIADMLGFDENRANTLLTDDGVLTGQVGMPILGRDAKVSALEEITASLGKTPDDAIAVGDGANDLGMLGLAGLGVALHAKPTVQAQCDLRVNHGDLTALLYLQGYARADFQS